MQHRQRQRLDVDGNDLPCCGEEGALGVVGHDQGLVDATNDVSCDLVVASSAQRRRLVAGASWQRVWTTFALAHVVRFGRRSR